METFAYALIIIVIVFLVLFFWQVWCVAVLKFVNPALHALHAPPVNIQMCGKTSDVLKETISWVKQFKFPKMSEPTINFSITPILLAQIGMAGLLIAAFVILFVILNQIIKNITANTHSSSNKKEQAESIEAAPIFSNLKDVEEQKDDVLFTAFHPKEGKVEAWHTLLVYAHIISAIQEVRRDSQRFKDELFSPKETVSASARIAPGAEITILPTCEGITFNPPQINFKWLETYHRAEFRFRADASLLDDAAKGHITIFVGPLIVGTVKFAMLFNNKDEMPSLEQEERSKMYHKDKIFISYSHSDTDIALAFKKVHEATGYDVLIDIDDLHSGQEWNSELIRMIDRADIFQLFWSENSKKSKYCKQEWMHALKRRTEGFIRPVYWQKPIPDPPRELSKYHFEYVELKE